MGLMYTSIRVKDMKESVQFYTKNFGLKVTGKRSPIPYEEVVSLEDKSTKQRLNLMWYGKKCRAYTPWKQDGVELDHLMFSAKNARKIYNALVKKGAPVAMEFMEREMAGRKMAAGFVLDPNGIWVGVRQEERS